MQRRLTPIIARQLHMSLQTMSLSSGLANAAYAAGTVLAVQLAQHLPQRRMLSEAATLVGSGLTGIGLGATVAPALFGAGFSLPSASLQRVFAIVELMRAVAAFMIAPIFAHLAATVGGNLDAGTGRPTLAPARDALVACVWQTGDVGFLPIGEEHFNAAEAAQVRSAAEETAAHGASLAEHAGFRAQSIAIEAAPTWKGIVEVADERRASLIVLGSHRRSGLAGHLLGSVAAAVAPHSACSVLIVHC